MRKHRDGRTAICPWFRQRSDWRDLHMVECKLLGAQTFPSREDRDEWYEAHCCIRCVKEWRGCVSSARTGCGRADARDPG